MRKICRQAAKRRISPARLRAPRLTRTSDLSLPEKMTVTGLRHPFGARQMSIMDTARAIRLEIGVDAKQDMNGFGPLGTIGSGIQQSHVQLDMGTVVGG